MEINIKGIKTSYRREGNGNTIIFMHGWLQSKECFNQCYAALDDKYDVIGLDWPGFGNSQEPKEAWDNKDYAEFLHEFIEKLEIKNPVFVCHSFAARVVFRYLEKYDNASGLILTGAAGIIPKRDLKYKLAVSNYKILKLLVKTPFYSHYKSDLFANSGSEDYKNSSPMMKQVMSKSVNDDLKEQIKAISLPTLLYWGQDDDATPVSDGKYMHEMIKNSKLIIKENSGHFAYLENIVDFNAEMLNFLEKDMKI